MIMSNIDYDKAILSSALVSLTVDTLFFGLFSGACAASLWLLVGRNVTPHRSVLRRVSPAVVLGLMFMLALTYLVLDIDASLHGFVVKAGNPDAMMHGLTDIRPDRQSHWATKMTILFIQIVLADAFMVHRLYVVWDRNHWAAFTPALFWLASIVAGGMMVANLFRFEDNLTGDIRTVLFFGFSCVTNGLCSVLIIGRLIRTHTRTRTGIHNPHLAVSPHLTRIVVLVADVIIQSAVVYFAASLGLLIYVVLGLPQPLPKWIIGGMPSFIGISTSAIVLWELHAVETAREPDSDGEKLGTQTA
ncbi:hypothetical protein C8T65DRAFT_154053 [Cerioporus squamosus]|nr:hypothetical protein C8T65DRAFT_154053 [Cerioporus squamosus]